jgi:hypothetical protein
MDYQLGWNTLLTQNLKLVRMETETKKMIKERLKQVILIIVITCISLVLAYGLLEAIANRRLSV